MKEASTSSTPIENVISFQNYPYDG